MKNLEMKCWGLFLAMLMLLAAPFLLAGCKSHKPLIQKETEKVTITETVHDTVLTVQADSSSIKALIECQNGKPVIKGITEAVPGRKMAPPKLRLQGNVLDCECESQLEALRVFYKNKIIEAQKTTDKPIYIERELTWWQVFQIWAGRIALLAFLIWFLKTVYNPFKFLSNGKQNI